MLFECKIAQRREAGNNTRLGKGGAIFFLFVFLRGYECPRLAAPLFSW